jgi:hypothetical protein
MFYHPQFSVKKQKQKQANRPSPILIQVEELVESARLHLNRLSGKGQTAQNALLALTET